MHSDACKEIKCQSPLKVRNITTGEIRELLCWDFPAGAKEQVATLAGGERWSASSIASFWEVQACDACGEKRPATDWPGKMDAFLRERAEGSSREGEKLNYTVPNFILDLGAAGGVKLAKREPGEGG